VLSQKKIEKIVGIYDIVKLQTEYKAYDRIAANKFRADGPETQLVQ